MVTARFIILAALIAWAYGNPTSRILGGENAATANHPYAVSLRLDNAHICGGSIISPKHVLTAAHCLREKSNLNDYNLERLSVRVGSINQYAGGKLVQITGSHKHPDFVDLKNDVAILTLAETLEWTERIQAIEFAKTPAEAPAAESQVTIAGWGEQVDGAVPFKLQQTILTVADEKTCADALDGVDDTVICLNHNLKQGSCRGDAGNGAVHNGKLVGVSNFVIGACGARYPDVYANVAYFGEWIDSSVNETL